MAQANARAAQCRGRKEDMGAERTAGVHAGFPAGSHFTAHRIERHATLLAGIRAGGVVP